MEAEFVLAEQALQARDELAAKDAAEDLHRQKEWVLGVNPPYPVRARRKWPQRLRFRKRPPVPQSACLQNQKWNPN